MTVTFADLGVSNGSPVRYPWTHSDAPMGSGATSFTATVPRHGVVLIRAGRPSPKKS
jgi:hypothetical protein